MSLKRRCEHVTEGTHEAGSGTLLNKIYTELYITEGQSEEVDTQHEVRQLERTSKKNIQDTPIKCQDIFKVLSEQQRHIRVVLTNGVAGVGKTFSVQKFSLDWAEGLENQDISLVLPLSCRELNLIRDEQHSLLSLLHVFHPTLQKIRAEDLTVWKLLFIFDGLDESRFSLGFNKHQVISDVTQVSSVEVLLVNLIQGNLLPSALIWITSRPAAAIRFLPRVLTGSQKSINIFHCLMEMKDQSVHQEIQEFLKSGEKSERRLSEIHCSALADLLQMSEEVLDELNLQQYNTSEEGRRRLIPAVRNCRKFVLWDCRLSEISCDSLASALRSNPSHLRVLDLSWNQLKDPGVKRLCGFLSRILSVEQKPPAEKVLSERKWWRTMKLAKLHLSSRDGLSWSCGTRLRGCRLSETSCDSVASALKSNLSHLRVLDLSYNPLQDSGVKRLCSGLESPNCKLERLRLEAAVIRDQLWLSGLGAEVQSLPSQRTGPESEPAAGSGVKLLCGFLQDPNCRLETLSSFRRGGHTGTTYS
ncbi:NACHT, LRR and PYD domains-containing protein 4C NALP-alpha [Takifugu flavidus]|uniref:NACHT, LRR and PYD domains-containing protein 4C NALP-alpha n=1 Tax=Takifugu flavidus TaxID=433684 RepID=A0A5C6MFH6_9TELE|nr:NACHT, LRR and PYD domains-containing protein 4C NALP-alpha [Takifugu flavidus]